MFRKTPIFLLVLTFLLGASALSAQTPAKYGHMNLGNFLEMMPETKKANDVLQVFADSLSVLHDTMSVQFRREVLVYQTDYQAGKLPPVQAQQIEAELQKKQEAIEKFERDAQQSIAIKRDSLLRPILVRVQDATKAVAVENGYLMIFDTSSGAMLFAAETEDVTELVKKKLGI